jgi:hypothetical protein
MTHTSRTLAHLLIIFCCLPLFYSCGAPGTRPEVTAAGEKETQALTYMAAGEYMQAAGEYRRLAEEGRQTECQCLLTEGHGRLSAGR